MTSLDGATGVLQDSVEEFVAPVSKAMALARSSESLEELSKSMGDVDNETTVSEVTVTIVDLGTVGVDPDLSGGVKTSAVSSSLGHANMSDSDEAGKLVKVERDSAEHDLTGVDWGVSLGEQTGGSDVAEVEDNDGGSVESDASMFILTSPLGIIVAVLTGAEWIPSSVSTWSVVLWMSVDFSFGILEDDWGVCFDVFFFFPEAFFSKMTSSFLSSLLNWPADNDVVVSSPTLPRFRAERLLHFFLFRI